MRKLVYLLFSSKYFISAVFSWLTCNFISGTHLICTLTSKNHHSYFAFTFLNTADLFQSLFRSFKMLNTCTVPSLSLDKVQKRNYYFSVSNLTSKNISCTLFLFRMSTVFLHFDLKMHKPYLAS